VFNEVVKEGKRIGAPEASLVESLFKEGIIRVIDLKDMEYLKFVKEVTAESERQPLYEAEAEALFLAIELNGIVVADNQVARSVARLLGVELHGAGYVLGRVFAAGKIKKEKLMERVKEMRDIGWRVSAEDYLKIIQYLKSL
jgi:predicted nucleic acid-binding protein